MFRPVRSVAKACCEAAITAERQMTSDRACPWCGKGFTPRRDGGKEQRFCSAACRHALDAAGRRWITATLASGALTLVDLRNGTAATRALLPRPKPREPLSEPPRPAPVMSAERPEEAADLLYALLAVQSDGWTALAAAMSDVLFDRLKHWHRVRLAQFRSGAPKRAGQHKQ
jgi:hypothetical protein